MSECTRENLTTLKNFKRWYIVDACDVEKTMSTATFERLQKVKSLCVVDLSITHGYLHCCQLLLL